MGHLSFVYVRKIHFLRANLSSCSDPRILLSALPATVTVTSRQPTPHEWTDLFRKPHVLFVLICKNKEALCSHVIPRIQDGPAPFMELLGPTVSWWRVAVCTESTSDVDSSGYGVAASETQMVRG